MNTLRIILGISLFFIFFSGTQRFDYTPRGKKGEVRQYQQFTTCYSEEHEQPYWVAYELTQAELLAPKRARRSKFDEDKSISTGSAIHDDYTHSGYDRGHLSRAEYNKVSLLAYKESYLMSNVSPQIGVNFNQTGGDWYNLEQLEKRLAWGLDVIYGVSGPIFEDNLEVIGLENSVTVPGYYFKAILSPDHKQAIAFVLTHDNIDVSSLWDTAVTIDELEGMTGIDFFTNLGNEREKEIEGVINLDYWKNAVQNGRDEQRNHN